ENTMTVTEPTSPALTVELAGLEVVAFDLYRDIHKALRAELFGVTAQAGSTDPGDADARIAVATRWNEAVALLVEHAEHEDEFVQPVIERHAPQLAPVVVREHEVLEQQMAQLEVLADRAAGATGASARFLGHQLYLGLANFTAAYTEHLAFEELEVNVELSRALGPDELLAVDQALVASIPPDRMGVALGLMLPAMNADDRAELLGGAQQGAPAEVFAGMLAVARGALAPADYAQLTTRLGVA
ncbi:MAG: hemerythrin domain-containing protein, partial [Acidimicrobiia bacterium]